MGERPDMREYNVADKGKNQRHMFFLCAGIVEKQRYYLKIDKVNN